MVKNLPARQEPQDTRVQSLGQEDPREEGMANHSSIIDWRILWTEEPGKPQSIELQRLGHDQSNLTHMHAYICTKHTSFLNSFSSHDLFILKENFMAPEKLSGTG